MIDCGNPATRATVRADSGRFVSRPGSVLIDPDLGPGTRVDQSDLAGIRALHARLGKRLAAAMVLRTGALTFRFDDALWSKTQ